MIEIDEKCVGIWYLATAPESDWLAGLREITPEEKYELTYRFRYYKSDDPFDSGDKKKWYKATMSGTRNYCLAHLRDLAKQMKDLGARGEIHELMMNEARDVRAFYRELDKLPFAFSRLATPEEREYLKKETD